MRIVTTTSVFPRGYPADDAINRLARLGFEGVDMAFDYWVYGEDSPFLQNDYADWAKNLRKLSEKLGVPYTHSHAPGKAGEFDIIDRTLHAASILGARYVVVHPVCELDNRYIEDPEEFIQVNREAIIPSLRSAKKYGIVILSENLLDGASTDPRVIAELVKSVDSEWFGWCYDTGHANCFEYKQTILNECPVVPLSLHIQDNNVDSDDHLIPGDGNIDWDEFARSIKSVDYKGDCVLEAHHQCKDAPDDERDGILTRLLIRAKSLCKKIEEN